MTHGHPDVEDAGDGGVDDAGRTPRLAGRDRRERQCREYYGRKTAAIGDAQSAGTLTAAIAPDLLDFLLLSLAGYWAAVPQVARMITGATTDVAQENARRRASVVEAARRLASPTRDQSASALVPARAVVRS